LRSIRRSLTRSVFQSTVVALVLSKLDFGNTTLAGLPSYQLRRLQSVMNAAARLVFSASRYDDRSCLYFTGCTGFVHHSEYLSSWKYWYFSVWGGLAPTYLSDSLRHVADLPGRQRLRSASSADLAVPQTRLQTVGDRASCVAAAKTWNSLPSEVTSVTLSTFKQKLQSLPFFHCHFPARNISSY